MRRDETRQLRRERQTADAADFFLRKMLYYASYCSILRGHNSA